MLEAVRENLKGTLMVVVVIIFIVPMVISGVGTTFLGSVAGTDAATVNGESITNIDLERAIRLRRNQIQAQQGSNISDNQLTDELLRAPVLDQLTRRMAIVTDGEGAGMGLSDVQFANAVREQEAFFTDGKFNQQKYNSLLAQSGLTSAGFRDEIKSDLILRQQALGMQLSSFASSKQIEQLVKLTHQKRSFFATTIPLSLVEEKVEITDSDIQSYYEENKGNYEVPEKVKVDYLELSIAKLAASIDVSDAEILQQYEAEIANFNSDASYEVAHILLEGENEAKSDEVSEKITNGESFEDLAKSYSDDLGSSEAGGQLGVLTPGMFPSEFEEAVYALEEGQVSGAVKTDAGTHFIKVTKKIQTEVPSLESRKSIIAEEIAQARAADDFSGLVDTLGDLTYFSEDLTDASQQLGLAIQQSHFFDRNTGSGVADNSEVREAAFDEKVMTLGNNSNTIQIGDDKVVVIRLAERQEAYTKPLEEVLPLVEANVKQQRIVEMLEALSQTYIADVQAGKDAKATAEALGYEYVEHEYAKRTDFELNPEALSLAFLADKPSDSPTFESKAARNGNYIVVGVSAIQDGMLSDLEEAEKSGFEAQVAREMAVFDGSVYEASIVAAAKIKTH